MVCGLFWVFFIVSVLDKLIGWCSFNSLISSAAGFGFGILASVLPSLLVQLSLTLIRFRGGEGIEWDPPCALPLNLIVALFVSIVCRENRWDECRYRSDESRWRVDLSKVEYVCQCVFTVLRFSMFFFFDFLFVWSDAGPARRWPAITHWPWPTGKRSTRRATEGSPLSSPSDGER